MNNFLLAILQCGAFLLIPMGSFAGGLWLITRYGGLENRLKLVLIALLIGISFFEASLIGMLIDPRVELSKLFKIIRTAGLIGLGAFIAVLVFTPIYRGLIKMFK